MATVTVRHDWKRVSRALESWYADQVPFATAVALTRTASGARDAMRRRLGRVFTVRSRRVLSGEQSTKARKRDFPRQRAEVGHLDEYIARHEEGGIQAARGPHRWTVPTRRVKRGASGRIRKTLRPPHLIRKRKGFIPRGQRSAVFVPKGPKRRRRLQVFYLLRQRIRLDPVLGHHRTVRRYAERHFPVRFQRELAQASRTRRPRR